MYSKNITEVGKKFYKKKLARAYSNIDIDDISKVSRMSWTYLLENIQSINCILTSYNNK